MTDAMRRLVVEVPMEGLLVPEEENPIQHIQSVEVLVFLRHDSKEFAVISKVVLSDDEFSIEEVIRGIKKMHGRGTEVKLLDQSKDGVCTCMIRGRMDMSHFGLDMEGNEGYVTTPFELRDRRIRLTYLGNAKQVRGLLQGMRKGGVPCKVVSLTDARFSPNSPLSQLTEKQRKVLITAYDHGYYDTPRKVSTEQLAKKLNVVSSTFVVHRQKAEKRILDAIMEKT
jgi:hypothetical protein